MVYLRRERFDHRIIIEQGQKAPSRVRYSKILAEVKVGSELSSGFREGECFVVKSPEVSSH